MPSLRAGGEPRGAATATLTSARTGVGAREPGVSGGALELDEEAVARLGRGEALIRDDVLGPAVSSALARVLAAEPDALTPAGIGRASLPAPDIRGDRTRWLERADATPDGPVRALWALFDALGGELREKAWLGTSELEVQLAYYPGEGARYRRHRDAFAGQGRRRATAIYYLNPTWRAGDGGELRLFAPGGAIDVDPILDRLVVFLAEALEHAVLPSAAPRWAATAWYLGPLQIAVAAGRDAAIGIIASGFAEAGDDAHGARGSAGRAR